MKKLIFLVLVSTRVAAAQPATMQPIGEDVHIQPIVIPQDAPKKKDLRPIYAGVGLLLIGAAFWWNRKQREKFDRSDVKTDEDKA